MAQIINDYWLDAPFDNQNAGFSRWTTATKNGREFFIKEFFDPVYPMDASVAPAVREHRIRECEQYEQAKRKFYSALNTFSDGNLVRVEEFFRCDAHYYLVTEKIRADYKTADAIALLPEKDRLMVCLTAAHGLMLLHRAGIVHADIKETNVLIRRSPGGIPVAKIIDFDSGYFEADAPESGEELGGDFVYLSPEACRFMCGEEVRMTCKADVFSMGLLFHQYLTGDLPWYDRDHFEYAYEAVLEGGMLKLSPHLDEIDPRLKSLIRGMLLRDPESRTSSEYVYEQLREIVCPPVAEELWGDTPYESEPEMEGPEAEIPDENFDPAAYFHMGGNL